MTREKQRYSRRRFLGFGLGALVLPKIALAHDGHGAARVVGDVLLAQNEGRHLHLQIRLTNLSHEAMTLWGVAGDGMQFAPIAPVNVEALAAAELRITAEFPGEMPGIFTAILDFGEDGQGPLLVMT